MGNKLIDEPPLLVLPSLAQQVGLSPAVVLQQIHYMLENDNSVTEVDGQRWVKKTMPQWEAMFPFILPRTLRRIFEKLREDGIIEATDDLNSTSRDRTLWYTIQYDKVANSTGGQNGHLSSGQNGHLNKNKNKIRENKTSSSYSFSRTVQPLWDVLSTLPTFPGPGENMERYLEGLVEDYPDINHVEVCKDFVAWREDRPDLTGRSALRTFFKNASQDRKKNDSDSDGPGDQVEIVV